MVVPHHILEKLLSFLDEDMGFGDETSRLLIPPNLRARARILAKSRGILAGVEEASALLEALKVEVLYSKKDGSPLSPGETVMELEGDARTLLAAERVVLNLLMHMSGVATMTRRLLERARRANPRVRVAATRKTLPGLRYFEKKAVSIGGGDTHRLRLDDMVLIKNNHLRVVGSVRRAIALSSSRSFSRKVEVEVSTAEEAVEAAEAGADVIMFDNMDPSEISKAIEAIESRGLRERVLLEASGGIGENNVEEYAATGVDIVSIGALTHSARAVDMSLELEEIISTTGS